MELSQFSNMPNEHGQSPCKNEKLEITMYYILLNLIQRIFSEKLLTLVLTESAIQMEISAWVTR